MIQVGELYDLLDRLISKDPEIRFKGINIIVPDIHNTNEFYEYYIKEWECDADMNINLIC